jgi:hypothetical protein
MIMANLTSLGEQYVLTLLQGGFSASYTDGFDKIALVGEIDSSGTNVLLTTPQDCGWGFSAGKSNIYTTPDNVFELTVTTSTVIKGVALLCSGVRNDGSGLIEFSTTGDLDTSDILSYFALETPRTFNNDGEVTIDSLTYNFDRNTASI